MSLLVFGLGYTAGAYARRAVAHQRVAGTVRSAERVRDFAGSGVDAMRFDGSEADPALLPAIEGAEQILVSAQPSPDGDPVLPRFQTAIEAAPRLRTIVYLSTIGVYGDHRGAWIDEATPPAPQNERGRIRVGVENEWRALGDRIGKAVHVLRLAGIYGPGRNALADLRAGEARRLDKPGQVFNRIHVDDIGRTVAAAFAFKGEGAVWNVADDEPAPAATVVEHAAALLDLPPPPLVAFEEAELSPMARSFYGANRRVGNRAIKDRLGVALAFPTYREGLAALRAAGEG